MAVYLIQASAVLAILTLVYRLLLRREALLAVNRLMLWCSILLAFGLPVATIPDFRPDAIKTIAKPVENWVQPRVEQLRSQKPTIESLKTETTRATIDDFVDWFRVIKWFYLLGILAFGLRLFWQLVSIGMLIVRSQKQKNGSECLVQNTEITSPFSFFCWVFYNPKQHTEAELEQILTHEQVHISQWHSLDMLMAECVRIVLWFNPFAWWHQHLVQQNLEFIADRNTLNTGIDRRAYQLHLLKS
jgi:beta-lactamase regulating signal transducer with metallopeptidase domain